jgi:plasmid stabilization system protein ParE
MAVTIIWTKQALDDLQAVLWHLRENWSDDLAAAFSDSAYRKVELLENAPELGIASINYNNVRRMLLSRYNSLYYQYEPGSSILFILNIFDNRANPADNPYR